MGKGKPTEEEISKCYHKYREKHRVCPARSKDSKDRDYCSISPIDKPFKCPFRDDTYFVNVFVRKPQPQMKRYLGCKYKPKENGDA